MVNLQSVAEMSTPLRRRRGNRRDCRPGFFHKMKEAIDHGCGNRVELEAPLLWAKKHEVVEIGLGLDAPFHLTRTCYTDREPACGKCGSCQERLEAFRMNGKEDPIDYATRELLPRK